MTVSALVPTTSPSTDLRQDCWSGRRPEAGETFESRVCRDGTVVPARNHTWPREGAPAGASKRRADDRPWRVSTVRACSAIATTIARPESNGCASRYIKGPGDPHALVDCGPFAILLLVAKIASLDVFANGYISVHAWLSQDLDSQSLTRPGRINPRRVEYWLEEAVEKEILHPLTVIFLRQRVESVV